MYISIVMPCLNESETLKVCINKAFHWASKTSHNVEILIADNGSSDDSIEIAIANGANVISVPERGYGAAIYAGVMSSKGDYLIVGDSDDSYDFSNLDSFVDMLEQGFDLVMGSRFLGVIENGAMPWKNRYIGNPALTSIGQLFFNTSISDFHCGLRAFSKAAFIKMGLRTSGMEFASEMVIKASLLKLRVGEVPIVLSRDGRSGHSHLRPWRDGWLHLRLMMFFCPQWVLLIPGIFITFASFLLYLLIYSGPIYISAVSFDIRTLFYLQAGMNLGLIAISLGSIMKLIGEREGLFPSSNLINIFKTKNVFEIGAAVGLVMIFLGLAIGFELLLAWGSHGFGAVGNQQLLREVSLSTALISNGGVILLMSVLIGFLTLSTRKLK